MSLTPGTSVGPYEIVALIGAGGMGEVYRARDRRLGRDVALKVISPATAANPEALPRLQREARAVAALNHPNIVALYEFDTEDGITFIVTELLEGETLGARIRRGKLDWRESIPIAAAIADGLSAAHRKGVVHRDLKPENVFITAEGVVKLLDFGIARNVPAAPVAEDEPTTPISTDRGFLLGTLGYLSPEQLRGEPAGPTTDLFSFGCVLYEMLTGKRAFARGDAIATLAAVVSEEPPPVRSVTPDVPPALEELLRACLAKFPSARPSAAEVSSSLRALLTESSAAAMAPTTRLKRSRSKSKHFAMFAIPAALILAGVLWWLIGTRTTPASPSRSASRIVVLPFSTSGGADARYLGEGLADDLTNTLSRTLDLEVVARPASIARSSDAGEDSMAIARKLGATVVLTGQVVPRGKEVSLQLSLVDVKSSSQLWGERYDLPLSGMMRVERQIATRVAQSLHVRLVPARNTERTTNDEAYRLYLKGRYFWNKRTEEGFATAIESFEAALELDPTFAEAWSGLADCYVLSYALPERETMKRATDAAKRAIELDDRLADPHAALGHIKHLYEWDWEGSEAHFRKAIELNPGYATAHHWFGRHLVAKRKADEGMYEIRRAEKLDPLSMIVRNDIGYCLYLLRRYEDAVRQYQSIIDKDPDFAKTRVYIAFPLAKLGRYDEALAHLAHAASLVGESDEVQSFRAHVLALKGDLAKAAPIRAALEAKAAKSYVPPIYMTLLYVDEPNVPRLMHWLEKAYADDERSSILDLAIDPLFDDLPEQPAIDAFMKRIGLPGV